MDLLYARCAGLDVHKDMVMACARLATGGRTTNEVERFATTTRDLQRLGDWLAERGVTHVVMEATGVYWKPVWHVLESSFELVLANAQHAKNVPGRKSDVNDATWLADLLAHGLVRGSFVPPAPIQELRDLTRTRKQTVRGIAQQTLRIQKVLEDANIKLSSVTSDTLGKASRAILEAIIAGETDLDRLADLKGKLRASREELIDALRGNVTEHHRFMLRLHLDQVDAMQRAIDALDARTEKLLLPFREQADRLTTIPGVSHTTAQVIVAEVGLDMSRFATPAHLISWAGLCPRMDESAGKRRSTRIRKGAPWLKTVLTQAALSAMRAKGTYLRAQFLRIKGRRGIKKAIIAVAASILQAAYFILRDGVAWKDLGADYFDRRDSGKAVRRLAKRIEALGYAVEVRPAA